MWGWLLGPFALAYLRVYNDAALAASFLDPMAAHLNIHGLGTAGEIFGGDAPFTPRGCIAQAWIVAEVLRACTGARTSSLKPAALGRKLPRRSSVQESIIAEEHQIHGAIQSSGFDGAEREECP